MAQRPADAHGLNIHDASQAVPIEFVDTDGFAGWLDQTDERTRRWADALGLMGKADELCPVPAPDGQLAKVIFLIDRDGPAFAAATLVEKLPSGSYALEAHPDWLTLERIALSWALGRYRYDRYHRGEETDEPPGLIVADQDVADRVAHLCSAVFLTRDLINTPANDMGPAELEAAAHDLANRYEADFWVTVGEDLRAENFPLIWAVGQASPRAPRLIDLKWGPPDAPKVTLVGKGVCFDTGGLNLKPGGSMALMKKDMGGAANVLGLAHLIMQAQLPVRLRVLIPAVENAVAGNAMRPGDVFRSRAGLTVEIGNTDAEGRLVLADAMSLAGEEKPDLMVDMATLTGAARVALGPEVVPFFTDDEDLAGRLAAAAIDHADPLWRLPLWPGYRSWLKSKIADVNQISEGGFAGSITAALFLQKFATGAKRWVHFDVFGWTPKPLPGRPVGGEAQAIRALAAVIDDLYGAGA